MHYVETFDRNQMMITTWDSMVDPKSTARLIDAFIDSLKKIFREFNKRLAGAVEWGFVSVDGSKFFACNSRNNNFTKSKLDDRIKWLDSRVEEYMRILDETDSIDELKNDPEKLTKEFVEQRLEELKERLERYKGYQRIMEESGQSQMSLTDGDSKLMKSKNGFIMAYNPQTAVDSETHLIRDFDMTNQVADQGYMNKDDMIRCLEEGIVPHVIMPDGKDGYDLEIAYEEAEDVHPELTAPEELKKAIHAGIVPDIYKETIAEIEVAEGLRRVSDEPAERTYPKSVYGMPEEMMERAREGYFVRDPERNLVYCPNGEILRQKCIKKNGNIRYANKLACRHCPNRNICYKGKNGWKEIDFFKDCLEKPCRDWPKAEEKEPDTADSGKKKYHYEKIKIVRLLLKPDRIKMAARMCLSEHPFGTIKRAMGFTYFLLKGIRKVTGEFALMCLGYNIKRARNLLGFTKMMELMTAGSC